MIQTYVDKLFDTLPNNLKNANKPLKIDLILEGGAFNGSYLIGALYFLKKLEKNNIIEIKRISGASIGSFVGLLYFIDKLDVVEELYDILLNDFKKKLHLNIIDIANNNFKSNYLYQNTL
jgi:predicted acylesterase/phospholipase RssA